VYTSNYTCIRQQTSQLFQQNLNGSKPLIFSTSSTMNVIFVTTATTNFSSLLLF